MGKMIDFASIECSRIDWQRYEEIQGRADSIPSALQSLLNASMEDAEKYYWGMENHVVVQGQLFSAAEPALQVLIASLLNVRPRHTKIDVLELIFQIVAAATLEATSDEYRELQCRIRLRALEGMWVFYGELNGEHFEAASEILNLIDQPRLKCFIDGAG
ncbi:hypothetical protein [Variovorax sp. YR566]|uniref:hypothetical protein n=1 Tax=Variovorax sp. YR566 TaxID=3450237 RepID=UPI003F81654F